MLEIFGVVGGLVVLFTVFQWRNIKRSWQALCAQVNKASRFLWRADPIAIYQEEVQQASEEMMVCMNWKKWIDWSNKRLV